MSKVRDIINDASLEGIGWRNNPVDGTIDAGHPSFLIAKDVIPTYRRYIATFDPEHIALMEAVVEAADVLYADGKPHQALYDALLALFAYRREHGLV